MTTYEALIATFDTAVWAINNKIFNKDDQKKLAEELKAVIDAQEHVFAHEHYKKINGVWTHSGSFQQYSIVNNCANKRASFLVVLRGAALSVSDKVTPLRTGEWIRIEPNEVRSGLVKDDSRIMRVFVNTEDELRTFLEAM